MERLKEKESLKLEKEKEKKKVKKKKVKKRKRKLLFKLNGKRYFKNAAEFAMQVIYNSK